MERTSSSVGTTCACRRFSVVMELITAETTPTRNTVSAAIYSCSSHLVSIKKSRKKSSKTGGVLCVHACVCACLGIYIHGYITYLPTYIYIHTYIARLHDTA